METTIPVDEIEREFTVEADGYEHPQSPTDPEHGQVKVGVVQTPDVFCVRLQMSPLGETEFTAQKFLPPRAAQNIADQTRSGALDDLLGSVSEDGAAQVAADLELAVRHVQTMALEDIAGPGVIDAYREGKATADETAREMERQMDADINSERSS